MIQKIVTILIVLAAVAGIVIILRRQQKKAPCGDTCTDCPLAQSCTKDKKNL